LRVSVISGIETHASAASRRMRRLPHSPARCCCGPKRSRNRTGFECCTPWWTRCGCSAPVPRAPITTRWRRPSPEPRGCRSLWKGSTGGSPFCHLRHNAVQAILAGTLDRHGGHLHPGEAVQFIITSAGAKVPEDRVRPYALLGSDWHYDLEAYATLLLRAAATVLELFGYSEERLGEEVWSLLEQQ